MPQSKSAKKRMRQNENRRQRNRSQKSRMRTLMKKVYESEDKEDASSLANDVKALIDRLAAKNIIHKNKAARYKSNLDKHLSSL